MNVSDIIECPWGSAVFRLKVIVISENNIINIKSMGNKSIIRVGWHSGGRLAPMLVATIYVIIFYSHFFFSIATFSLRMSSWIKVDGALKNLGVNIFPDPVSHFGTP